MDKKLKKKILSPEAWGSEDFFPKNSKSRGQRAAGKWRHFCLEKIPNRSETTVLQAEII